MTVDISARKPNLIVGGTDLSNCLATFEGSDNHLDQSGFVSFTGQIVLVPYPGLTTILDDRKNPAQFCRGTKITLSIPNSSGVMKNHPRGALRILKSQFVHLEDGNFEQRLQVGDLIALLTTKEPTNPNEAQNFITQQGKTAGQIIEQLLGKAGWVGGIGGGLPGTLYNYPINLQGSYLGICGKLLYANNMFGWVDSAETLQFMTANINANTNGMSVVIGQDEILYQRLAGAESPVEFVQVVGTEMVTRPYPTITSTSTETYGTPASVVPGSPSNATIVLEAETDTQVWNSAQGTLTKTTTIQSPYGLVIPSSLSSSANSNLLVNITASIVVEIDVYEQDGLQLSQVGTSDQPTLYQYQEGKLRTKTISTYQPRGTYLSEYCQANPSYIPGDITDPVLVQVEQDSYLYDSLGRIQSINSTIEQLEIILLNGTGENWSAYTFPPENLVQSEVRTQKWTQLNKNTWNYKSQSLKPLVQVAANDVAYESGSQVNSNKLNLIISSTDTINRTSNSGQANPPATERCPPLYTIEENQIQQIVAFSDDCSTGLNPRQRTFTVDLLASVIAPALVPGQVPLPVSGARQADIQLLAIGQREGALLKGRNKGQEIALGWSDEVFSYNPLFPITVTELDGTIQYFLADGANWAMTPDEIGWHFDGVWVGTGAAGGAIIPPYIPTWISYGALGWASQTQLLPYSLEPIEFSSQAALGWACKGNAGYSSHGALGWAGKIQAAGSAFTSSGALGWYGSSAGSFNHASSGALGWYGSSVGSFNHVSSGALGWSGKSIGSIGYTSKGALGWSGKSIGSIGYTSKGALGWSGKSIGSIGYTSKGALGWSGKSIGSIGYTSKGALGWSGSGKAYLFPFATSATPGIVILGSQFTITQGVLALASSVTSGSGSSLSISTTALNFSAGNGQFLTITLPKFLAIVQVTGSPCRFRLYSPGSSGGSITYQSADYPRPFGGSVGWNAGVILDVLFNSVFSSFSVSSVAFGFSATNSYPYTLDSTASGEIQITYIGLVP